ncbi:hypothetical protein BDW74DRAFT_185056 [Aspergillus multicolor]|uniref:uncharacterized protein n=1 Tax=Aspergillus multicolor TaxID=41759 RepID=UPI003CCCA2FF
MTSPSDQNLHSQAFNFTSCVQEGVDTRTGQYTCRFNVYKAPTEARNCPSLKLHLVYSTLSTKDTGLGQGWTLDFTSYQHRKSKHLSLSKGEQYRVTETSNVLHVRDQKLKNFQFTKRDSGDYQLVYKDGQIEVFSNKNDTYSVSVPIEIYAANGRSLQLAWTRVREQPRLSQINDGDECLLEVKYGTGRVEITRAPGEVDARLSVLSITNNRLIKYQLSQVVPEAWQLEYSASGLSQVTSLAGLVEVIRYSHEGHRLPPGAPFDSVSHTQHPGGGSPSITTTYWYSFLKHGEDNLYLVKADYQYSCTEMVTDGPTTDYTYNKFHLLVQKEKCQGGNGKIQTTTYYTLENVAFDDQPPQYQLPQTEQTTYQDKSTQATRTEITEHKLDEWGNPTREVNLPVDWLTPTKSTEYRYQMLDSASREMSTRRPVVVSHKETRHDDNVVTRSDFTYYSQPDNRDHGRLQQEITAVDERYPLTTDRTYEYPEGRQFKQNSRVTTFDGITTENTASSSLITGMTTSQASPEGIQTDFEYDQIDRKVTTTQEYALSGDTPGYEVTVTGAKGVQIKYTTDGLERTRHVQKQDDDGQFPSGSSYNGTFHPVQEQTYNSLGQCIGVTDIDWLGTDDKPAEQRTEKTFDYDGWGQICSTTKNSGLVTLSLTDPVGLTSTEDALQGRIEYSFDGLGRQVQKIDKLGRKTQYSYDGFDRVVQTVWPDGHTTTVQYATHSNAALPSSPAVEKLTLGTQSFDGERTVAGRTTLQSYDGTESKPSEITTAKKEKYRLTHEPALDQTLLSLAADSEIDSYQYDPQSAVLLRHENSARTQESQYLPSGLLSQETIEVSGSAAVLSTRSTDSMSGRLQSYTNVHGQTQEIAYDTFGRPAQFGQGTVSVVISYDTAERLLESFVHEVSSGTLLKTTLEYDDFGREIKRTFHTDKSVSYALSQTYGEIGLITEREVQDNTGNILRHEIFKYDELNRMIEYQCEGLEPPVDDHKRPLRRLQFTFDKLDNGSSSETEYIHSENDPTQLVRLAVAGAADIQLEYYANGCLIRDEQGRKLEYDTTSRLIAVRDASGQEIISQFSYDASGKLVCQTSPERPDTHFFYRGNTLIAVRVGDSRISYISDGKTYHGQIIQEGTTESDTRIELWVSDSHQSIIIWQGATQSSMSPQPYTPYGFGKPRSATGCPLGFNGQCQDPVTGWYHMGNGTRVYNPVLMRFHTPDPLSPFTSGEVNPYNLCLGDPINRTDPSGHFSFWDIFRPFVQIVVFTAGAATAFVAGVMVGVGPGLIYDAADGNPITPLSVAFDVVGSVAGGALAPVLGAGASTLGTHILD